jgi:hypothetical protein
VSCHIAIIIVNIDVDVVVIFVSAEVYKSTLAATKTRRPTLRSSLVTQLYGFKPPPNHNVIELCPAQDLLGCQGGASSLINNIVRDIVVSRQAMVIVVHRHVAVHHRHCCLVPPHFSIVAILVVSQSLLLLMALSSSAAIVVIRRCHYHRRHPQCHSNLTLSNAAKAVTKDFRFRFVLMLLFINPFLLPAQINCYNPNTHAKPHVDTLLESLMQGLHFLNHFGRVIACGRGGHIFCCQPSSIVYFLKPLLADGTNSPIPVLMPEFSYQGIFPRASWRMAYLLGCDKSKVRSRILRSTYQPVDKRMTRQSSDDASESSRGQTDKSRLATRDQVP